MFQRILLAYDGSSHAKRAYEVAVGLAFKLGARLDIVQVVAHQHAPEAVAAFAEAERAGNPDQIELAQCAANSLTPLWSEARSRGINEVGGDVLRGDPAHEIVSYAQATGSDLIVMGRRGRGRIGGLVLGSVSSHLTSHAECPVLTVK